jgi:predicted  nucleic acid-binding Zn-ribbon protein
VSSAYKRTIVLGLDYAEFSGGITECNRKMGLLDAEFKLAKEQAKNYGTETDQLTVKQEALSQMIDLQTKIVDEHRKAYDKAMSSGTATEKQIDSLDKQLLTARTTLVKLNGEYDNASKELEEYKNKNEEAGKEVENSEEKQRSFGDTIRSISSTLGLEASPAIEAFASKFDGLNENVGIAMVTMGAMATKLFDASKSASEYADNVMAMSSVTGLSTETLQKMDYAAELVDVSTEQVSSSMTKMIKSMAGARDGNEDLQKTFARLGVRYKEGNKELRNAEDTFYDLIDALGKIENETERDAKSMELFGRSAKELNPLIDVGSKKLRELGEEGKNLGYVMDDVALDKLGALDDSIQRLNKSSEGLQNSFGLALAPIMTAFFDTLAKVPIPVLQSLITLGGTVASIMLVVKAIKEVTSSGKGMIDFFKNFDIQAAKTTGIVIGVVAALIALVAIIAVLAGQGDQVSRTMDSVGNNIGKINKGIQSTQYYATGTDYAPGGKAWVGENGPELLELPRGSRVISAEESRRSSGGDTYNLYAQINAKDIKEWNDVVSFAQQSKQAVRAGRSRL